MSDRFLDDLHAMTWPTVDVDRPDPAPGQLWRAAWEGTALVVAITEATELAVTAIAGSGPDAGDEHTVTTETGAGVTYSLWTALERTLPTFVLDYCISDIDVPDVVPADGVFPPITSVLDDRSLVRADLLDALDTLEDLSWTDEGDGADLAEAAAAADLTAGKIAVILDVNPGAARRFLQGTQQPTAQQAEQLADLLGVPVANTLAVDVDLVVEMNRPSNRPQLISIAADEHGGDELAARRAVAEATLVAAARERSGRAGKVDWAARLRQELNRHG